MDPLMREVYQVLEGRHRQLFALVDPLDDAEINAAIPGLTNTIGIVLRHIAGSQRYWVAGVAGGEVVNRSRDAEFGRELLRKADLLDDLRNAQQLTARVLERLRDGELQQAVTIHRASGSSEEVTKASAILHAAEHLAYHLGQVRLMVTIVRGRLSTAAS